MTVDTYGKWLPKGDKAAIDSLDDAKSLVDADSRRTCTNGAVESGDRLCTGGTVTNQSGDRMMTLAETTSRNDARGNPHRRDFEKLRRMGRAGLEPATRC